MERLLLNSIVFLADYHFHHVIRIHINIDSIPCMLYSALKTPGLFPQMTTKYYNGSNEGLYSNRGLALTDYI